MWISGSNTLHDGKVMVYVDREMLHGGRSTWLAGNYMWIVRRCRFARGRYDARGRAALVGGQRYVWCRRCRAGTHGGSHCHVESYARQAAGCSRPLAGTRGPPRRSDGAAKRSPRWLATGSGPLAGRRAPPRRSDGAAKRSHVDWQPAADPWPEDVGHHGVPTAPPSGPHVGWQAAADYWPEDVGHHGVPTGPPRAPPVGWQPAAAHWPEDVGHPAFRRRRQAPPTLAGHAHA